MSRSFHEKHSRRRTAFNRALKSDNHYLRTYSRWFCDKVKADDEYFFKKPITILREVSNPWDYD